MQHSEREKKPYASLRRPRSVGRRNGIKIKLVTVPRLRMVRLLRRVRMVRLSRRVRMVRLLRRL